MYERDYKTARCLDCNTPCTRGAERCRSCREKFRWRNPDDPRRRVPPYPLTPDDPLWPECQCGCGEPAPVRIANNHQRGFIKGEPCKFVDGHAARVRKTKIVNGKKHCSRCGSDKPLEEFNKCRTRSTGFDAYCRECMSERHRTYHKENREVRAQKARDRAAQDPEGSRERHRQVMANWRNQNREKHLAQARIYASARRARKVAQFVEHVDAAVVYQRDNGICGICQQPVPADDFHVDHIVPLVRGGEHSYANTQVAHPSCNSRKKDKLDFTILHASGSAPGAT